MPPLPTDRPLDDVTAELTGLLGSTDPVARIREAYRRLSTWIQEGAYDDVLAGLGDGMAVGLEVGLGQSEDDSVFRRSWTAKVLADCIARDNAAGLLSSRQVLLWGDRIATWLVRERDLRGHVGPKGAALAVAHGADAIAELACSSHFGLPELTVLLDVVADRLLLPTGLRLVAGEPDRLARATVAVLARDLVPLGLLEPWIARLANGAVAVDPEGAVACRAFNTQSFLRALYLQVAHGPVRPAVRSDLLLVIVEALRETTPELRAAR
ncbi:DUF2785 domain-containing protein [Nocardioides jiangxiensis]|uniref:DUF2785 domain-containing protein n=1 Tax=Nocardioides jiangxiensis TaxID=3064524 RepID=A0ABT9AZC4_9ACTN|nr:DUF2785 domain-containing protein [Nocardioides sp. WY-20]MDO7867359.1 DUF2785 domain-containing protein [Nocardioides sp. WY-20]